ncbi:amidase family protein [Pseudoalteromonas carrageenovora]|uniref:amidase family protein n=1 Tax=Pseudoalteromonas TaxID=53246 RepID=UPI0007322E90|nr:MULTISPECIES: amidase family protein [Pseudoalteromonas]KTF09024.1 amidase [Pseudoalteromonas sp. H103]MDO6635116.1 amidase family protein [Pseudoalteromonas carrageenovora]MDO6647568.1 amidase family protein [Pseudoalteromonas carrageenovora]
MTKTTIISLICVLCVFSAKANNLKTIEQIHIAYKNKTTNAQHVTQAYINRIEKLNPQYNAVINIDPSAIEQAKALDLLYANSKWAGPLHGIPVLLKDNIETKGKLPTTAGSLALKNNITNKDAFVVKKLREAGAIILGKANLSEWANFRSSYSSSGWSAVGGQTHNAHDITRNPCGSSAGSAVAVALNFAPIALGTETDGSITCPASVNGVYAIKPSMDQVSRNGVIPLSSSQDTVGPMAHTLKDALLVLAVLQGKDKKDVSTHEFVLNSKELTAKSTLKIGALPSDKFTIQTQQLYKKQLNALKQAGHTVTEIEVTDNLDTLFADEYYILLYDFKAEINHYLSNTPKEVKTKSLEALINFNSQNKETEMPYFGQDILTKSQAIDLTNKDKYQRVKARYRALAKSAITNLYKNNDIDIVIAPTVSPAWKTDLINGDNFKGSSSSLPAIAGSTHITLPLGKVSNLPVGLSIIANINQEQAAYTYADIIDKTLSLNTKKPE